LKSSLEGLKASDLMSRDFQQVVPDLPVEVLVKDYILRHQERNFLVSDGQRLVGIVCLEDIKKFPGNAGRS